MWLARSRAHHVNILVREVLAHKGSSRMPAQCRILSSAPARRFRTDSSMHPPTHVCDIDAEPLHRYRRGGYHPIHLGDLLKDGRYKVLHKLGWGKQSTVWAARDLRTKAYVAVKVSVSEPICQDREISVLHAIAAAQSGHPGHQCLMAMHDHFQVDGPNGTHNCLVLEILGPSVARYLDVYSSTRRLSGPLAKSIVKQTLLGLRCLHEREIGHADLHTRNLAFTIPSVHALREEEFLQKLGGAEMGPVKGTDQRRLESGMPQYLVKPAAYPIDPDTSFESIKIVDFGQSFLNHESPSKVSPPLIVRAPEIIFKDKVDHRMDLWSMGCIFFELIVGQPLFDPITTTPTTLVRRMLGMVDEELPDRWRDQWHAMNTASSEQEPTSSFQNWLEETYFDGASREDLTHEDIVRVGALSRSMLRLEPSARASSKRVLQDPWFQDD